MKKHILKALSFVISILILLSVLPLNAFSANSSELVDGVYYKIIDNEAIVTGYSSSKEEVIIKSEYKGCTVTAIGEKAFYCTPTKDLNGIYYRDIPTLETITIPNTIKRIGKDAFSGCNNLKTVIIDDIKNWCYINFENVASNPLHYSEYKYVETIFQGGSFHAVLRSGYKSTELRISRSGINYPIQNLVIDNGIEGLSDFCFAGCKSVENVFFSTDIKDIGNYAFYDCRNIKLINFEKSVKNIGDFAFKNCINLKKICIEGLIENIGSSVFDDCNNLEFVNVKSLKSWFETKFTNCKSNPLYYDEACGTYGKNKIRKLLINDIETTKIKVPENVSKINAYSFAGYYNLEVLEISENVEVIEENAFIDCINLKEVSVPENLSVIKESAFDNCKNISKVNIKDISNWCNIRFENFSSNPLCNASYGSYSREYIFGTGAILYLNNQPVTELNPGNAITEISRYSFANCKSLESVVLPENLSYIGELAFFNCKNIKSLKINNGSTDINENSFQNCNNLTAIKINDIRSWCNGNHNFSDFQYSLYIGDNELTDLILPNDITKIQRYAFAGCISLNTFTVSQNLTNIGENAFKNCKNLKRINIDSLEKWCDIQLEGNISPLPSHYLFLNEKLIDNIIVPNGIKAINNSFQSTIFESITLPKSIESFSGLSGENIKVFENSLADKYAKSKNIDVQYLAEKILDPPVVKRVEEDMDKGLIFITVESDSYDPYEYSIDLISWQKEPTLKAKFEPNKQYKIYQRIYKTVDFNEGYPSEPAIIQTKPYSQKPGVPILFNVNSTSVYLIKTENYEYKIDGGEWQSSNVFLGLQPNSTHNFYQRVAETDNAYASEPSEALVVTTLKNTVNRPVAPTVLSKTSNSITLKNIDGYEYKIDDGEWQSSNIFSGLKEDTEYTFYQRIAETEVSYASESSAPLKISTNAELFYTIVFKNWDGSVLSSNTYHYGDTVIVPNTPTRPDDDEYTYTFAGWDSSVAECNGNKTYTATFNSVKKYVTGDLNGDNEITDSDVLYLLKHTFRPEKYPINQPCDYNNDGKITDADAVYLLKHIYRPEKYPLSK